MSLSKQLLILISTLFLMIFIINFVLSVNNIRDYLQGESAAHAQDTATSLGLSLSPYMAEETDPVIETMMNAIFDMGYYQEITLVNLENKSLVTLVNKKQIEGVPDWFVNTFSMKTATAESEISSGWNPSGVVHVSLNPGFAYLKLYEQAKNSLYYSAVIFIFAIFVLLLVLRFTLSSLKKIDQLALTIAGGNFETIEYMPWTTEVKNVTTSMNMMSKKIEGSLKNLNKKLTSLGRKVHQDDLTGLGKKHSFESQMKHLYTEDVEAFIFKVKIDGLNALVKELDEDTVDQFLIDFSQVLLSLSKQHVQHEISAYRFFGSEFVLLIKNLDSHKAEQIAQQLGKLLAELGLKYRKSDIAHIGISPFNPINSTEEILLAADEAYEQARLISANSYFIRSGNDKAKDIAEWKSLVFSCIEKQTYQVKFVEQINHFQTGQLLMEEAFSQAFDDKGNSITIGAFISIAEKFSKIVDLDKGVTLKVIEYINSQQIQHAVAINLSTRTIKDSTFRTWLSGQIKQNKSIADQLVFSLSVYAVAKEIAVYKEFITFIHNLNAKVIFKRFEAQSISTEVIKDLKPDFIRLSRELCKDIATDKRKQAFLGTIQEICELLDIRVLGENVIANEDYQIIEAIGIAGASR